MRSILSRRNVNPPPEDKGQPELAPPSQPEPAPPTHLESPPREKRAEIRYPASHVPSITEVRLSPPRTDAVLINISEGGLLAECATRFQPGILVTISFMGGFSPASVSGRVARSAIARMGPEGVRYQVGIAFSQKIVLPDLPPADDTSAPATAEAAAESKPADLGEDRPPVNRW